MSFKLTAVTATYNRETYLPRCIESVAGQPYPHKEHVIIDGGSTDETVSLLQSYSANYSHIKWLSEKDNGISDALNKGLAMATGDAIGVIGDDDFYAPDVFGIIAAEFERDPDVGIVSGNCQIINNKNSVTGVQKASYSSRADLIQCWRHWGKRVALAAPTTFIRRQVIEEVGGFDEEDRYAMDYHHWLKITKKFPKVRIVDKVLASFRCDSGSVSFSSADEQWSELLAISKRYWSSEGSRAYCKIFFSYLRYYQWPLLTSALKNRILSPGTRL